MQTRSDQLIPAFLPPVSPPGQFISPIITDMLIFECENFIAKYLQYQQIPLKEALRRLSCQGKAKDNRELEAWDFIMISLKAYKGDFGKMYINLSDFHKLILIETWGFHLCYYHPFQDYKIKLIYNGLSETPVIQPVLMQLISNMMMFFTNHFIHYHTTESIRFDCIPPTDDQRTGNSLNWAKQLISTKQKCKRYPETYRSAMIGILSHYKIKTL